jgi:flagellar biosynthesis/type III secretory pathway ATPase
MATIRSISPPKSPERLLNRRLARQSASTVPLSQRKLNLSKAPPITVTAIKRRKSSRMSKKSSVATMPAPARLNSFTTIPTTSENTELTNKMASTTINELPPIRSLSRITDVSSVTSNTPTLQNHSDTVVDHKQIEEPQNDNPVVNHIDERPPSPLSRKSSEENIEYTIESFDIIRTVGTGKIFLL